MAFIFFFLAIFASYAANSKFECSQALTAAGPLVTISEVAPGGGASRTIQIPKPSLAERSLVRLPTRGGAGGFILLFYRGQKLDAETLSLMKTCCAGKELQHVWNPFVSVGAIITDNEGTHKGLASHLSSPHTVLGGTRYEDGRHINSLTFENLMGLQVEELFFDVKVD